MTGKEESVEVQIPAGMSKEEFQKAIAAMAKEGSKKKTSLSQPIIFKSIESGPIKQIRIHINPYKGRLLNSIQQFWRSDESEEWQFGKGVTFDYEAIDEIIEGLTRMKEWLEEHPKEGGN